MPISGSGPTKWSYEFIEIDLDGGETQVLEPGIYHVHSMNALSAHSTWAPATMHIEVYSALESSWEDFDDDMEAVGQCKILISNGVNTRAANGAAPGTHYRLLGVRVYFG